MSVPLRSVTVTLAALLSCATLISCATDTIDTADKPDKPLTSDLYGPCGTPDWTCASGLSCVSSRDDPSVFLCTRPCEPAAKCPQVIDVGACYPMLECGTGCCEINNTWSQSSIKVSCAAGETVAVLSDGFCQPWP